MRALDVIVVMFLLTQVLSLGVGTLLIENQKANPSFAALNVAPDEPSSVMNAFYFLISILVGAGMLLIILMFPFRDKVILFIEFLSTTVACFIVFFVLLSTMGIANTDVVSVLMAVAMFAVRLYFTPFRNVLAVVASAGIGAVIGFSIDPLPLIVFAILVAIYDLLAVKWTGHMVQFAKHFMKQKTSFSVGFEGTRRKRVMEKGKAVMREEPWMIELGSGDMAIASAITVVSYKLGGFLFPLAAMAGSAVGLYLVMARAAKEKEVMPAMPMIVSFSLIFVAVAVVIASLLQF